MDGDRKSQFIDLGFFNEEDVDLMVPPESAEHYLKQVMKERSRAREVVRCSNVHVPQTVHPTSVPSTSANESGKFSAPEEWQRKKCTRFEQDRQKLADFFLKNDVPKIGGLPQAKDEEAWRTIILERCIPELQEILPSFPNHSGTPPAIRLLASLPQTKISYLLEYLGDWADDEGFTRPIREWFFALMLIVDLPLLHDVVASLRSVAKMSRQARNLLTEDRVAEIAEFSFFIAIISGVFGQSDLKDK